MDANNEIGEGKKLVYPKRRDTKDQIENDASINSQGEGDITAELTEAVVEEGATGSL